MRDAPAPVGLRAPSREWRSDNSKTSAPALSRTNDSKTRLRIRIMIESAPGIHQHLDPRSLLRPRILGNDNHDFPR